MVAKIGTNASEIKIEEKVKKKSLEKNWKNGKSWKILLFFLKYQKISYKKVEKEVKKKF